MIDTSDIKVISYNIRHGQSLANAAEPKGFIGSGYWNGGITELGVQQAHAVAHIIQTLPEKGLPLPTHGYDTGMERTIETLKIIRHAVPELVYEASHGIASMKERYLGCLTGADKSNPHVAYARRQLRDGELPNHANIAKYIDAEYLPDDFWGNPFPFLVKEHEGIFHAHTVNPLLAETWKQFSSRVNHGWEQVQASMPEDVIPLLVAHRGTIKARTPIHEPKNGVLYMEGHTQGHARVWEVGLDYMREIGRDNGIGMR